jgi:hypothetical protein
MGIFDLLTEARIREWQERSPEQKEKEAEESLAITGTEPMEVQLFKKIIILHKFAGRTSEQSEQNEILTKATKLQIQLMEVLEQSGRPLAVQQVSENIRQNLSKVSKKRFNQ